MNGRGLPWPWRWRVLRTLRGKLIAGLVALLAIACATVGVVTYFAVQRSLSGTLSNQLQSATSDVNNCLDFMLGDDKQQHSGGAPSYRNNPYMECGAPGTFVAYYNGGRWTAFEVPGNMVPLAAADKQALAAITPSPAQHGPVRSYTQHLESMDGTYKITVVDDPNGTYVTGLPLAGMHDTLRDVALVEAAVFGGVLLLAGVLGTAWVRLSLRPLRRVAATASQVARLPLESGEVELPAGVPDTDPDTETGQVGLAFNRMLGHVQAALTRRAASETRLRRFAADASHELRTPLAAIRGYAELGLLHPGDSPEAVTHALGRVLSESTRMSVLVDDLLLLARLDAGRPLSREPVDMTRLAIDAASDSRVARPDHRWMLELPDDPVLVSGDEHRLRQVLGNVLSNAGRHTPDGTTVTVAVSGELPPGEPATGPAIRQPRGHPARAVDGADRHRRRTRRSARPAARPVRAVHPRRHLPVARDQRLLHRARPGDRGRGGHGARRRGAGDQPAGHDALHDHAAPAGGGGRAGQAHPARP